MSKHRIFFAFLGLVCLVSLYFTLVDKQGYREMRRLGQEQQRLQMEIDELEARRKQLTREIDEISNDPRALERRAREDLGMVRPGETVFLHPGDKRDEP